MNQHTYKQVQEMKPLSGNYISSGRFQADQQRDQFTRSHEMARASLRAGNGPEFRYYIRRAIRELKLYRYFRERAAA